MNTVTYKPKLFSEGNWIFSLLMFIMGALVLSEGLDKEGLFLGGFFIGAAVIFILSLLRGTWLGIEEGDLFYSYLFFRRKKVKVDSISKIVWRGAFIFSQSRMPLFDIYVGESELAFTINPKPYSKQQFINLTRILTGMNPRIVLDERLVRLSKSMDGEKIE